MKFKVGDVVRIIKILKLKRSPHYSEFVGRIGTIKQIGSDIKNSFPIGIIIDRRPRNFTDEELVFHKFTDKPIWRKKGNE